MDRSEEYERLLSLRWTRPLSPEEEVRRKELLQSSPDLLKAWEVDRTILEGLGRLPDVPLSPDFTRRVMRKVSVEPAARADAPVRPRGWMPRLGWGFALLLALGCSFVILLREDDVEELAGELTEMTRMGMAPTLEELQHFEVIDMLGQVPSGVDWDLIAAVDPLPAP